MIFDSKCIRHARMKAILTVYKKHVYNALRGCRNGATSYRITEYMQTYATKYKLELKAIM